MLNTFISSRCREIIGRAILNSTHQNRLRLMFRTLSKMHVVHSVLLPSYCLTKILRLAIWHSNNALVSIIVVALHRARPVCGWVTVRGFGSRLHHFDI